MDWLACWDLPPVVCWLQTSPYLLIERAGFMQHEDNKPWDNVLARLVGLGGALIPLVTGLDAKSGWSETDYRLLIEIVALTFIVIGYALSS